jgi:cyclopropane-fatty-acyl-phospholipid synthase
VYSCAYFENGNEDLASAQLKRIDHILRKIQVQPGQKLLDIGCGWGALVLHAAQKFGAQCVGVTPSQNQFDLATERVKAAGLSDKIEIRLQDYRDVQGQFDCITSVGMFEHVGQENLEEYQKIRNLLADDGIVINHGITTTHPDNSPRAIGARSFIGRYVFPSGDLPPHLSLLARATQKVGLETLDIENLRPHYVRTLELWGENFEAGTDEVRKYIDDERFRLWGLYLACLAHAFAVDDLSLHQMVCYKPGKAPAEISWLSRQHMYSENIKH